MQKLFTLFATLGCMLLSVVHAENPRINWAMEGSGTLTISGTGEMDDYHNSFPAVSDPTPWAAFQKTLTTVIIKEGITSIGQSAFEGCASLTTVKLPSTITKIGKSAFAKCSSLSSINLPENLEVIEEKAFYKCAGLASLSIPRNITSIGDFAFSECKQIRSVTLPKTLTQIGKSAFKGCEKLSKISIPEGIAEIPESAFAECVIDSVRIPNSVTTIGKNAFAKCEFLEKISLGTSLKYINSGAFGKCTRLTDIYCRATSVPSIENSSFVNGKIYLWVPKDRKRYYERDKYWQKFSIYGFGESVNTPVAERRETPVVAPTPTTKSTSQVITTTPAKVKINSDYVVTAPSTLNIRSAPTTRSALLGTFRKGEIVHVESIENGTWAIVSINGKIGYISTKYIKPATAQDRANIATASNTTTKSSIPAATTTKASTPAQKSASKIPIGAPIYMDDKNTYYCNGQIVTEDEVLDYLVKYCPVAINEIQRCENASKNCNISWFTLGLAGVGLVVYGACDAKNTSGVTCLGLGGACLTACVPLVIVSLVMSKHAVPNGLEIYNAQCTKRFYSSTPSVDFKLQVSNNGFGFAINF